MSAHFRSLPRSHPSGHTVDDVKSAGFTLEPMVCVNKACGDRTSGNVTYNQAAGDAYCSICGEWQEECLSKPAND